MRAEELQRFAQELHDRVARRCEEQCDRLSRQRARLTQRALARDRRQFHARLATVADLRAIRHAWPPADTR